MVSVREWKGPAMERPRAGTRETDVAEPRAGRQVLAWPSGSDDCTEAPGSFTRGHATVQRVASLGADRLAF